MDSPTIFEFDERWYLDTFKDVAAAVSRGEWPSGYMHYNIIGRSNGQTTPPQ
jgi:hypothetical protein